MSLSSGIPGSADDVQYGTHFLFLNSTVIETGAMGSGSVSPLVSQKVSETLSKEKALEVHPLGQMPTSAVVWGALRVPGSLFPSLALLVVCHILVALLPHNP